MGRHIIRLVLCAAFTATAAGGAAAQPAALVAAVQPAAVAAALQPAAAAATTNCGAAQTTQLTPNSQSVATSLNNVNNAITIAFRTGNVTYWTVMLSTAVVDVVLSSDRGNAVVTFKTGLALHLTANGSAGFNIFLSGTIVDDGTTYTQTGAFLGTFTC